jgi:hypothetical protein
MLGDRIMERLPDSKIATKTRVPSVASARGLLPRIATTVGDDARFCRIVDFHVAQLRDAHERALRCAGEDDVGRLVADVQRRDHVTRCEVDDAHRVGHAIDDPCFAVRARAHRHGVETDGDRGEMHRQRAAECEDFQAVVGGIHDEQLRAVGRHVDGMDRGAFPVDERRLRA